jgi:hypothetical protein
MNALHGMWLDPDVERYKRGLAAVITNKAAMEKTTWHGVKWELLRLMITDAVTADAVSEQTQRTIRETLVGVNLEIHPHAKSVARIAKKAEEAPAAEAANARKQPGERLEKVNRFKTVSDLCAVRISCRAKDIMAVIGYMCSVTAGDAFYVRGDEENQYGDCFDWVGKPIDIVQYAYWYNARIGHIVEIRIAEPFVFPAFAANSARRTDPTMPKLSGAGGFYDRVKRFILSPETQTSDERDTLAEEAKRVPAPYGPDMAAAIKRI